MQLPARRPNELSRLSKKNKTIHRAYGGHLAHSVVRERIIRAFLVEEQKIVKRVRCCLQLRVLGWGGVASGLLATSGAEVWGECCGASS